MSLLSEGTRGVAAYIAKETEIIRNLTTEEFCAHARINLSGAYLLNAQPQQALNVLDQLDCEKLDTSLRTLCTLYRLDAALQMKLPEQAESLYQSACKMAAEVKGARIAGMLHMMSLRYGVFLGEYTKTLRELDALPEDFTDADGKRLVTILRAICLEKLGRINEAIQAMEELRGVELLPFLDDLAGELSETFEMPSLYVPAGTNDA